MYCLTQTFMRKMVWRFDESDISREEQKQHFMSNNPRFRIQDRNRTLWRLYASDDGARNWLRWLRVRVREP